MLLFQIRTEEFLRSLNKLTLVYFQTLFYVVFYFLIKIVLFVNKYDIVNVEVKLK